ncbi:hypothetical protein [Roseateles noduli]|uniref:hypothetical protein n=1 Tax=Roseateles noduli TaxID=2052484 RepID=UPI003D653184
MRTIRPPSKANNAKVLRLLASGSTVVSSHVASLRKACVTYLETGGDPSRNKPLQLPTSVAAELDELYKAKRVRDGLQWIKTYRSAKGLSHCPLCGNNGPTTLEHYLPRAHFSEFTIFSWNLIPSCGTCNSKRNKYASTPTTSTPLIHPYLDDAAYD